jgi:asparagine synthase (glutamine-hydrolysing)
MCGIAGILHCGAAPIRAGTVAGMMRAQAHRGPDGEGFLFDDGETLSWGAFDGARSSAPARPAAGRGPRVALGHRRLAIIDLSRAGWQPMADPSRRYWITYNGELYNYIELRRVLEARGHSFRTQTDTEVVLAAFAEWGRDCLGRFNGMWAFAIWDAKERSLFCSRDRFGIKPFYYVWDGERFFFASEIKGLLAHPDTPRALNERAVVDYLLGGSVDHLPGETFFAGIHSLLPAHSLTVSDGVLRQERYWDVDASARKRPMTPQLVEECRELLVDAVRLHTRSDVPVGVTLSGGIDSATLTCLLDREVLRSDFHAFSALFPGGRADESRYARDVAASSGHIKLHVDTPTSEELIRDLPRLLWSQDEPFGDTSIYAHYRLMRMASGAGVKVILTGQGADEVFAGYGSYFHAYLGQLLASAQLGKLWREIGSRARLLGTSRRALAAAAVYHTLPSRLRTRVQTQTLFRRASWVRPGVKRAATRERFDPPGRGWTRFDWYLYESMYKWSIPHLVHHDDRNSMAFSVESRVPYLDYRLVNFLFATEDEAKIEDGRLKTLLREAGRGIIPASVTERTDKIGFYTPMDSWLSNSRGLILDAINTDFMRNNPYLEPGEFQRVAVAFLEGRGEYASPVWWGVCFSLWHEHVVKAAGSPAEGEVSARLVALEADTASPDALQTLTV